MSQRSKIPFNWQHTIYATILSLMITFSLGIVFSIFAYRPLATSDNPIAQQLAEALRNLFNRVGIYDLEPSPSPSESTPIASDPPSSPSVSVSPSASPSVSITPGPIPSPTGTIRPSAPDGYAQDISKEDYLAKVDRARDRLATMPANMQVKFTLGVHTPIRTSQHLSRDAKSPIKKWEAVGLVTPNREPIPITAGDLLEMFDTRPTTLYSKQPELKQLQQVVHTNSYEVVANHVVVTDVVATDVVAQSPKIAVIDLLIYNTETNKVYLAPKTRFADIFRDALNAVLNGELKSNTYDVHRLDMSKVPDRAL